MKSLFLIILLSVTMNTCVSAQEGNSVYLPAIVGTECSGTQNMGKCKADPSTEIIWTADHETGNLSKWERGGGIWISGNGHAAITDEVAHSGRYAVALTITADGEEAEDGVRLSHWFKEDPYTKGLPDEAYYSTLYYLPQAVQTAWWAIYQWKQPYLMADGSRPHEPTMIVDAGSGADGRNYLKLYSKIDANGEYTQPGRVLARADIPIPIGQWVHVECFYRWSQRAEGQVACWQDGVPLWDVSGIITEFNLRRGSYPRSWTLNNYASRTTPRTHTLYVDDAAIAIERVYHQRNARIEPTMNE